MEDNGTSYGPEDDNRGTQLELQGDGPIESPFDKLRQIDERGEFWSARDLMPNMEYEQWRRFVDSIERAIAACRNGGADPQDHIATSGKITTNARGHRRTLDDYRLSRHGAHLVAMNGDPRKEAVANAQNYFAVQTRKQEIAEQAAADALKAKPAAQPSADLINLDDVRAIKQVYQAFGAALARIDEQAVQIDRERTARMIEAAGREAAEEENAILLPKAAQADHHRAADGLMTFGDFANKLNAFTLQNYGVRVYHKEVWDFAGEMGLIIRGNTVRKNRPTSFATEKDYVRESESEHEDSKGKVHANHTSRLTPRGDGWLWDRAVLRIEQFNTLKPVKAGAA